MDNLPKIKIKSERRSKKFKKVPGTDLQSFPYPNVGFSKDRSEIVFLTSYPPRECGIATYSKDLISAFEQKFGESFKLSICPLGTSGETHEYPSEIKHVLNTDETVDYVGIAQWIDSDPSIDLVVVQHEFGLFSGNENAFIDFLELLACPVVMTMHTVLPRPDTTVREKVRRIMKLCKGIIVMTQTSADILYEDYGLTDSDITVIPHGTHLVPYSDKTVLKDKYDLSGKKVLSTFGFLGPGKSIETTLNALPDVVAQHPDVLFLVLGKTHPSLYKEHGEDYRLYLERTAKNLGILDHVRFVNRFLPLDELLEYLQLTDIYLFTSNDPKQAVSGTFSYALSCGCPVISTPIPHAEEVLKNGAGRVFDFGDSEQLKESILELLEKKEVRKTMSMNGLQTSASSAWENSAIAHARFFRKHAKNATVLKYQKPVIKFDHLRNMTTDVGLIQFSKINRPDIESGYTVDDNARALIATCQHYMLTHDETDLKYIRTYFNFIYRCIRCNGQFFNYVDKDCVFAEQNKTENLEDAFGRALWAIGYFLSIAEALPSEFGYMVEKANDLFEDCLEKTVDIRSPRAMGFMIKGLYYYTTGQGAICIDTHLQKMADRLVETYRSEAAEQWDWFEKYLTYANAVLPEALLMAYALTLDGTYGKIARRTFDFLLSKTFSDGSIRVISNQDWLKMSDKFHGRFRGGEQPIDVAYTILALKRFHKIFPSEGYDQKMEQAFNWFMGDNPMHETIYNPCTGGCYDGLEFDNVNLNQGAESTVSYLLARLAFCEQESTSKHSLAGK